ncbi:MAG TPA: prolipoprotein diacylglyceryl transferase [Dissulfurispiraceae bacterium]|nr:prolipoprotein diacylglyceryl transferase [Dissulfurispiraceae bacterium]
MIQYPNVDPEIIRVGPLAVRWYGVMYLAGFAASFFLLKYQLKKKGTPVAKDFVESLFTWLILGLLFGARLGHVIFYNPSFYLANPFEIIAVWHGGMSFHGGLIGSVLAGYLFCRSTDQDFWTMADMVLATAPIGLGLGRLGNFINGELFGRVTDVPWAMVFPDGGPYPRHPSQLYEVVLEGIVLFIMLWVAKDRLHKSGLLTALFLGLYGIFRFLVEFVREPEGDALVGALTMGQFLSLFMIVGAFVLWRLRSNRIEG